jgi:hypothetical protein
LSDRRKNAHFNGQLGGPQLAKADVFHARAKETQRIRRSIQPENAWHQKKRRDAPKDSTALGVGLGGPI